MCYLSGEATCESCNMSFFVVVVVKEGSSRILVCAGIVFLGLLFFFSYVPAAPRRGIFIFFYFDIITYVPFYISKSISASLFCHLFMFGSFSPPYQPASMQHAEKLKICVFGSF